MSQPCCNCGLTAQEIYQCSQCQAAKYCSKRCQYSHWTTHKKLCNAIKKETERQAEKKPTMFQSHIVPSVRRKLIKLVGEKCEMLGVLNGVATRLLWDTGAQVSALSKRWLMINFPDAVIRDVNELVDQELNIRTANGGKMPCLGWIELPFKLSTGPTIDVPFVVMEEKLQQPVLGFNVIWELLKDESVDMVKEIQTALRLDELSTQQTINLIQNAKEQSLAYVTTNKKDTVIQAGAVIQLRCRAPVGYLQENTSVIFEPDELQEWPEELTIADKLLTLHKGICQKVVVSVANNSKHDVVLRKSTLLGRLELVTQS